jgi:hypothetical protein
MKLWIACEAARAYCVPPLRRGHTEIPRTRPLASLFWSKPASEDARTVMLILPERSARFARAFHALELAFSADRNQLFTACVYWISFVSLNGSRTPFSRTGTRRHRTRAGRLRARGRRWCRDQRQRCRQDEKAGLKFDLVFGEGLRARSMGRGMDRARVGRLRSYPRAVRLRDVSPLGTGAFGGLFQGLTKCAVEVLKTRSGGPLSPGRSLPGARARIPRPLAVT